MGLTPHMAGQDLATATGGALRWALMGPDGPGWALGGVEGQGAIDLDQVATQRTLGNPRGCRVVPGTWMTPTVNPN